MNKKVSLIINQMGSNNRTDSKALEKAVEMIINGETSNKVIKEKTGIYNGKITAIKKLVAKTFNDDNEVTEQSNNSNVQEELEPKLYKFQKFMIHDSIHFYDKYLTQDMSWDDKLKKVARHIYQICKSLCNKNIHTFTIKVDILDKNSLLIVDAAYMMCSSLKMNLNVIIMEKDYNICNRTYLTFHDNTNFYNEVLKVASKFESQDIKNFYLVGADTPEGLDISRLPFLYIRQFGYEYMYFCTDEDAAWNFYREKLNVNGLQLMIMYKQSKNGELALQALYTKEKTNA